VHIFFLLLAHPVISCNIFVPGSKSIANNVLYEMVTRQKTGNNFRVAKAGNNPSKPFTVKHFSRFPVES
jgi:hypothetical protein